MESASYRFGSFAFDEKKGLTKDGRFLPLQPKVRGVLECLLQATGQSVSKCDLIRAVWGDAPATGDSLFKAIRTLRKALDDTDSPPIAQCIHGRGYRIGGMHASARNVD